MKNRKPSAVESRIYSAMEVSLANAVDMLVYHPTTGDHKLVEPKKGRFTTCPFCRRKFIEAKTGDQHKGSDFCVAEAKRLELVERGWQVIPRIGANLFLIRKCKIEHETALTELQFDGSDSKRFRRMVAVSRLWVPGWFADVLGVLAKLRLKENSRVKVARMLIADEEKRNAVWSASALGTPIERSVILAWAEEHHNGRR